MSTGLGPRETAWLKVERRLREFCGGLNLNGESVKTGICMTKQQDSTSSGMSS